MALILFLFIALIGWTLTTYFIKKDSQKFIRDEVKNLFSICKKLFASFKNLIGILASNSLPSYPRETSAVEENILDEDEQPLSLVHPVKESEVPSLELAHAEDDDIALSSFSQEVVEVIKEEEEKVA